MTLRRIPERLVGDPERLVARPFLPGAGNFSGPLDRVGEIANRVSDIPHDVRSRLLTDLTHRHTRDFGDVEDCWLSSFQIAAERSDVLQSFHDRELQLLVGAYLTQTYAYEAVALTNPAMVAYGSRNGDRQPFVMSARAIGEGHISSIAFLTGTVGPTGDVALDPRHPYARTGVRTSPIYSKTAFGDKLNELGFLSAVAVAILDRLPETFERASLETTLAGSRERDLDQAEVDLAIKRIHWLAASNYRLKFEEAAPISSHLIAPAAPAESRGMEDARFVRFTDDDGSISYYATYTAFDGVAILPQLIETPDFHSFRMATMTGPAVHHKGMALFPRRINGDFVALSRHDHERSFVLRSDSLRRWSNAEFVYGPQHEWETVQTGNCGSPIETDDGWLVITHGVGAMRRYTLGALLLDLKEPTKVLGRLRRPMLEPADSERYGYVPDVVYSCGSLVHNGNLVVPYGYSDTGIGFAVTAVDDLLDAMQ